MLLKNIWQCRQIEVSAGQDSDDLLAGESESFFPRRGKRCGAGTFGQIVRVFEQPVDGLPHFVIADKDHIVQ